MSIKLKKQAASSVQIPSSTHVQLFVDSDGQPKIKDDSDAVTELSQSNYVTLNEQLSAPPAVANKIRLYSKDVAGVSELFVEDDQGQEIQITNNGAINVVSGGGIDTTVTTLSTSVSPAVDTSTFCANPFTIVTLPDGPTNIGKRLAVTFGNVGGKVVLTNPYPAGTDLFVNELGLYTATGEIVDIAPGTYEFRAVDFSAAAPGLVLWVMHRMAGSYGRKSQDVSWCLEGDFPAGYVQTAIPGTGRWYITGTGTTPASPVIDSVSSYQTGDLVLAPFESLYPGVYRVIVPTGGVDWKWELIELPNTVIVNEVEFRVSKGEIYGARKFYANKKGSPPNSTAKYLLDQAPCQVWPDDATFLDGTGGGTHAHLNNQLLLGRVNLLDTSAGGLFNFTLSAPLDFTKIVGDRFAVKNTATDGTLQTVTITVPGAQLIEQFINAGPVSSVDVSLGLYGYAEWQVDPGGIWRLVSYQQGFWAFA